jgi:predicted RNA-binding protein YlxR (DUF448 family)
VVGPTRTCIGCRTRSSKAELIRLVSGGTSVSVDGRQVQPGRGAYLHRSPECVAEAVRRRAVARALRRPGLDAGQLPELVRSYLDQAGTA